MSNLRLQAELNGWALYANDQERRVNELEDALDEIKSIIQNGLCSTKETLQHVLKVVEEMS